MTNQNNELDEILEMVKNYGHISNKPHMTVKQAREAIQALYAPKPVTLKDIASPTMTPEASKVVSDALERSAEVMNKTAKPVENGELDMIDVALCISAQHGIHITDKERKQFYVGFRHTQAYRECYEAIQDRIAQEKAKARIDELKRLREFWGASNDPTLGGEFKFVSLCDLDKRLIFLKEGLNDE